MRKMLLLSIWLFSVTRCEHPKIQVSGQEGRQVHISCPYGPGYETYPKYFKKGIYAHRKTVVKSTDTLGKQRTQDRKYDLFDDTKKRILHVTIYNLNLRDAGTYWCEIDAYIFDPKTEIELKVHKAPNPQPVNLNPPMSTTVETISMNQQQSTRTTAFMNLNISGSSEEKQTVTVTVSGPAVSSTPSEVKQTVTVTVSGPTVSSTPSEEKQTAPLARKELYLGVTVAALLLVLLVVLYLKLRNHRLDKFPVTTERPDIVYATVTSHRNRDSQRSIHHPVTTEPSDIVYATVTSHRSRDAQRSIHHPVPIQTQREAERDQYTSEDDSQSRTQIISAAGPSVVYATVRHTNK